MSELTIKLENLQATLTDPVSNEDILAAWSMVDEIIGDVRPLEDESERLQKELNKLHCRITIFECNWDMGGYMEPLKFWEKSWRYIDELVPPEHQSLTWCNEYEQALGG